MKILLLNALLFCTLALTAQNKALTFTEIEIDGPVIVELVAGTSNSITATKASDLVRWEVNGDALVIMAQYRKNRETPEVRVTAAQLEALETTGSVIIKGEGEFAQPKLELKITSQSIVSLEVNAETLEIKGTDQSILNLKGAADDLQVRLDSQSILNAQHLRSGKIAIRADHQSVAKINGAGADVTKEANHQSLIIE